MRTILFWIFMIGVPGLLSALMAGFIAFAINPDNRYCIPVDPTEPFGTCTLTFAIAGVIAMGFLPGGAIGALVGWAARAIWRIIAGGSRASS